MRFGKIGCAPMMKKWTARDYVQDGLVFEEDNIVPPSSGIQAIFIGVGIPNTDVTVEWCGIKSATPRYGIYASIRSVSSAEAFSIGWWTNVNNETINARIYYQESSSNQNTGDIAQLSYTVSNGNTASFFNMGRKFATYSNSLVPNALASCGTPIRYIVNTRGEYIHYYSLRVYSRALTAEEIAANYRVDRLRFNLP